MYSFRLSLSLISLSGSLELLICYLLFDSDEPPDISDIFLGK